MSPDRSRHRLAGLTRLFHWRRVVVTLSFATLGALMLSPGWTSGLLSLLIRLWQLGLLAMLVFGLFERWPRRVPRWFERWVLQVVGVGLTVPLGALAIYLISTPPCGPPFWTVPSRMEGFQNISILGVLLAPWVALGSLVRQKEALARHQALEFALERSELERQALDARMRLLQAQVAPHFLFNTLANVQALVDAGSPQAPTVLRNLITYLRAAVPRLNESTSTLADEVELVRAYLDLMHMRMPDRLHYELDVSPEAMTVFCPPVTLLTLIENAVRHGIDPSEEGGRIEVRARLQGDRCHVRVSDTGVGLRQAELAGGTGLVGLRERLSLIFSEAARLRLTPQESNGVCVELDFPVRREDSR